MGCTVVGNRCGIESGRQCSQKGNGKMSEQERFCQSCAKFKRGCELIQPNPKRAQRVWRCQTCIDARKQFAGLRKRVA